MTITFVVGFGNDDDADGISSIGVFWIKIGRAVIK